MPQPPPPKPLPPVAYLRECLAYEPETGALTWKARPLTHFKTKWAWRNWNARFAGKITAAIGWRGFCRVFIGRAPFLAHRIAWAIMTGEQPPMTIDHTDGDRTNNRWVNLRPATNQEQAWNQRLRSSNTTGFRGIYRHRERWVAQIRKDGVPVHIGVFDTKEAAAAAYEAEARKAHGKFYRAPEYAANLDPALDPRHRIGASGFRGVYGRRNGKRWEARLVEGCRIHHLGTFLTPEDAYEARCKAARELVA
jgi:HNH endonuclease/AP2 domain